MVRQNFVHHGHENNIFTLNTGLRTNSGFGRFPRSSSSSSSLHTLTQCTGYQKPVQPLAVRVGLVGALYVSQFSGTITAGNAIGIRKQAGNRLQKPPSVQQLSLGICGLCIICGRRSSKKSVVVSADRPQQSWIGTGPGVLRNKIWEKCTSCLLSVDY